MADAFSRALGYLTARSRTVQETNRYLLGKGYPPEEVQGAVARLLELDLLNDEKTARQWVEYNSRCKYKGRERLLRELRARGVDPETVEKALEPLDDEEELRMALELLAPRRAEEWPLGKLYRFLRYRGFSYCTWERVKLYYENLTE